MKLHSKRPTALVLAGLLIAGSWSLLRAQEVPGVVPASDREQGRRCARIHEALIARGIPLRTVRCRSDGTIDVILRADASPEQIAEADRVKAEVLDAPLRAVGQVNNLQDALVVLQFEPANEDARRIVRERYDQLRH